MNEIKSPYLLAGKVSLLTSALIIIPTALRPGLFLSNALGFLGIVFFIIGLILVLYANQFDAKASRLMKTGLCYPGDVRAMYRANTGFKISGFQTFYVECTYQNKENETCYVTSRLLCARKNKAFFLKPLGEGEINRYLKADVYVSPNHPKNYAVVVYTKV